MKKFVSLIALVLGTGLLWANDAYLEEGGGSLIVQAENEKPEITMQKEFIRIDLYEKYYTVAVDFSFYNDGPARNVKVGFPNWGYGTMDKGIVQDFKAYTNGEEVSFSESESDFEKSLNYIQITKWFVRDVYFPSKEVTKTRVEYKCVYGRAGFYRAVQYLFGTGSTWKDVIGEQIIKVVNHDENNNYIRDAYYKYEDKRIDLFAEQNDAIAFSNDNEGFIITVKNIRPSISDVIDFEISKNPLLFDPEYLDPGYVEENWVLSNEVLSQNQLKTMSDNQLYMLRNMIFAWRGNIFKSKKINQYLKETYANPQTPWRNWYKPHHKVQESELNETERQNSYNILQEEKSRKILK